MEADKKARKNEVRILHFRFARGFSREVNIAGVEGSATIPNHVDGI